MKPDETVYVRHILDAINRIESYLLDVQQEKFQATPMIQDATIRQLEILGEAAKRVSPALRARFPAIPWQDMAGLRDKLIHGYFGVDLDKVWITATEDLPPLRTELQAMLADLSPE